MLAILGALGDFLKVVGVVLGLIQQQQQKQAGIDAQVAADEGKALDDAQQDIAARDAVMPLRPDGLMRDGTKDPGQRD